MGGIENLFGKGKYRVISVFRESKDSELHFREICRIAGMTQPTVLEHLKVLSEIGFLKVRKSKNQKLFSLNNDNAITKKIMDLIAK